MQKMTKMLANLVGGAAALAVLSGCAVVPESVVYRRPAVIYEVDGPTCYGGVLILPEYRFMGHGDWRFHPRPWQYQRPHFYQPAPRRGFPQGPGNQHYGPQMPNRPDIHGRPNNPPRQGPNQGPERPLPPGQR